MRVVLSFTLLATGLAACGDDGPPSDAPIVVVTTSILGDVVDHIVGNAAHVEVLMPRGADPHQFSPSTRQVEAMTEADLLVINGAGFEAGLDDAIAAAARAGVRVYTFTDHVPLRRVDEGLDPHIWTDPATIVKNIDPLVDALVAAGVERAAIRSSAARYELEIGRLGTNIATMLDVIPDEDRVLVTNHDVLGYFADRYRFEVVGTVVPSTATGAATSAADVDDLVEVIEATGIRAIFTDASSAADLAEALADAVGHEVEVVTLHTESLGDDDSGATSYLEMMRTTAERIRDALHGS